MAGPVGAACVEEDWGVTSQYAKFWDVMLSLGTRESECELGRPSHRQRTSIGYGSGRSSTTSACDGKRSASNLLEINDRVFAVNNGRTCGLQKH